MYYDITIGWFYIKIKKLHYMGEFPKILKILLRSIIFHKLIV